MTDPKHQRPTVLYAFVAGPLGGAVFGSLWALFTQAWTSLIWFPIFGAILGFVFATPVMLSVGLAAHGVLVARGFVKFRHYVAPGAVAGMGAALIFGQFGLFNLFNSDLPPEVAVPSNLQSTLWVLPQAAVFGASCAYAFWFLRRPDRDPPNPPTSPS